MSSWIPGYRVLEGPERTGVPLRFTGSRLEDGAPAWIRVDEYVPNDPGAAMALARIYQLAARFEHPELPPVLGYGATNVPGRPFIAYHLTPRRPGRAVMGPPADAFSLAVEVLAELQLLAYESGTCGLHLPGRELLRLGALERVEGRRLPAREYLVEPRRGDGAPGFAGALPDDEWIPFTAPEGRGDPGRGRVASVRQAVSFRLAAQAFTLVTGRAAVASPAAAAAAAPPGLEQVPLWSTVVAGLDARPDRRPALEAFLSLGACA